jgi:hypothetical protein
MLSADYRCAFLLLGYRSQCGSLVLIQRAPSQVKFASKGSLTKPQPAVGRTVHLPASSSRNREEICVPLHLALSLTRCHELGPPPLSLRNLSHVSQAPVPLQPVTSSSAQKQRQQQLLSSHPPLQHRLHPLNIPPHRAPMQR